MRHHGPYKEELDFRDLLRHPQRLFGYTYLYVLGVLILAGILYVQRMTEIGKSGVATVVVPDSAAQVVDIALQAPQNIPPVDLVAMANPTAGLLARGKELYGANCSPCHGVTGLGDGPSGLTLNPKPRNFHTTDPWTNGAAVSQIYTTLQEGILRNGMASFSYLAPADRFAVVHFVRTFVPAPPMESPAELQQLESRYQLSKGSSVPAKVPVRIAARKVVEEYQHIDRRIAGALAVSAGSSNPGATLFRRVAADPRRVWTAVLSDSMALLKSNVREFAGTISADPLTLGFTGAAARLTASDYATLQNFLESVARGSGPRDVR